MILRFFCAALLCIVAIPSTADEQNDLVLILDASNSMWGQIDGINKIVIARESVGALVDSMPDNSRMGLLAYGHRRQGDCSDIEVLESIATLDRAALKATVNAINPKGKTPIAASINTAVDLLGDSDNASIVLVSDGLETCGQDPCAAVRAAKEGGAPFVLHVVGFDINDDEAAELECVAQEGGGLYLGASDADELTAALAVAYEKPSIPDGKLSVQVTADGALQDSIVRVRHAETGADVAAGRTYSAAATNPRVIPLDDGRYHATVDAVGIKGTPQHRFDFEIVDGNLFEKSFDFSPGELSVLVTRNGELSDAVVTMTSSGTAKPAASGRTYTSDAHNPKIESLSAGRYDVVIRSVELRNAPELTEQAVEIVAGERTELSFAFNSGVLAVGSHRSGQLVDSVVRTNDASGKSVAGGRTYSSDKSNPKEFVLLPGEYSVSINEVRGSRSSYETTVTVTAGNTTTVNIDLDDLPTD